ncbi:hypothetical protein BLOT_015738 [Blomia tropicalis]|nr:hypothetical protein BLOT_015738 [Blomia tropicalis]
MATKDGNEGYMKMNKLQIMFHIVLVSYYMAIIGETYCAGTQSPQSYLRYYLYSNTHWGNPMMIMLVSFNFITAIRLLICFVCSFGFTIPPQLYKPTKPSQAELERIVSSGHVFTLVLPNLTMKAKQPEKERNFILNTIL